MCSDAYSFKEKEIFVIKNFVNKKLPLKIVKVEVFCAIGNFSFPGFVVITLNAHFGVQ